MNKRLLSLLLALVMVAAIAPLPQSMTASAAASLFTEGDTDPEAPDSDEPSDGYLEEGLLRTHLHNVTHPTHLSEGSISVSNLIRRDPSPGLLSFEKGEAEITGDVVVEDWSVDDNAVVRFTLSGGKDGDTVTLPVVIHSEAYGSDTLYVAITLGYDRLAITSSTTMVYGTSLLLTCDGLKGDGAIIYTIVDGDDCAAISGNRLTALKAGTVTIKAMQVMSGDHPTQTSESVRITILKATPTGVPKYTALTRAGQKLSDVILTNGTFSIEGTLEWVLPEETQVIANVPYEWIFTPADFDNYECVTGMVTPYVITDTSFVIGSGTTVLNSDGSYTTTSYGEDDSRYELTQYPDGRMRMVHRQLDGTIVTTVLETDETRTQTTEKKDGSSQIISRLPNGTIYSVETNKYGEVSVQISLPRHLTLNASKNNTVVELPIPEIPNTDDRAGAPVIMFSIATTTPVRVSIPINSPSAGTVAILVAKNGRETVVMDSVSDKDSLLLTLTGSAVVKVADIGMNFVDVDRNDWFYDAADFVTSRGLFQGVDHITFAPEQSMSRAMVVQVLHNLEHNPDFNIISCYTDTQGKWYDVPASWATYHGYINGFPDSTFRGEENITREQLAVILYRYMGQPSVKDFVNTTIYNYFDYADISGWARTAMYWAVNSGILYTDGSNYLSPLKDATRAEVAQTIQNLVEYLNR